jgi:5-methylcytosine-specific restriction endonuclease McrA
VARRLHQVPFSRANIYLRDRYQCQYCGNRFSASELTFDHVTPASQGGRKDWENIVTCCIQCNRKKGGKTPEAAGLKLVRQPGRPSYLAAHAITYGMAEVPTSWRDFL